MFDTNGYLLDTLLLLLLLLVQTGGKQDSTAPALTSHSRLSTNKQQDDTETTTTTSDKVLSLSTSNEYKPVATTPWTNLLAEPYRETTLTVTSSAEGGNSSNDLFFFTIWDGDESSGMALRGRYKCWIRDKI